VTSAAVEKIVVVSSGGGGDGLAVVIPLIVGVVGLFGVLLTLAVNGWRANRDRRRSLYAGGWAAVQSYKEMAFAIRRRDAGNPGSERVRLSEAMREIQRDLAYHEVLIGREGKNDVAQKYRGLVAKTREVAGAVIKRSWDEQPISSDSEMHAPAIAAELNAMRPAEDAYMDAVAAAVGGHRQKQ
jgi:hypothetical protein